MQKGVGHRLDRKERTGCRLEREAATGWGNGRQDQIRYKLGEETGDFMYIEERRKQIQTEGGEERLDIDGEGNGCILGDWRKDCM